MCFRRRKEADIIKNQDKVISTLRKTISELETEKELLKGNFEAAIEDREHDLFSLGEILDNGKQWKVREKELKNYIMLAVSYLRNNGKEEPKK